MSIKKQYLIVGHQYEFQDVSKRKSSHGLRDTMYDSVYPFDHNRMVDCIPGSIAILKTMPYIVMQHKQKLNMLDIEVNGHLYTMYYSTFIYGVNKI